MTDTTRLIKVERVMNPETFNVTYRYTVEIDVSLEMKLNLAATHGLDLDGEYAMVVGTDIIPLIKNSWPRE